MFTVDRSADTTDGSDAIFLVTGRTVADGCRGLVTGFGEGAAFAFLGGDAGFRESLVRNFGFQARLSSDFRDLGPRVRQESTRRV